MTDVVRGPRHARRTWAALDTDVQLTRQFVPPSGIQTLTSRCGHHCGVQTSQDVRLVGHCPCGDCHDGPTAPMSIERKRGA